LANEERCSRPISSKESKINRGAFTAVYQEGVIMVDHVVPEHVRYAVVGLGHISQAAVLPAFKNASENSKLTALVSDDPVKLKELAKKYKVERTYSYEEYDACLQSGLVDAVYIALPNHLHAEYTIRAARAGVHVLCEKPMAVTEAECREMMQETAAHRVKLMIAYRLHFEETNLKAAELVRGGAIGEAKYFESCFSMQVKPGGIRVQREAGGGTLYDIGVYCINAARYLFRDEPTEVMAFCAHSHDPRFTEVDEATTAMMRFPDGKLAMFTCSFGAADVSSYRIVGAEGDLRVDPAYHYTGKLAHHLTVGGKTTKTAFRARDHFAPELLYFSKCILHGEEPEPSGTEGLADVRIIEAMYRSAVENRPIEIERVFKLHRPTASQDIERPAVSEPELVQTESPHH
jgi:predicted dehydrogenase